MGNQSTFEAKITENRMQKCAEGTNSYQSQTKNAATLELYNLCLQYNQVEPTKVGFKCLQIWYSIRLEDKIWFGTYILKQ